VDVVERPGQWQRDAVHAATEILHLEFARRPSAQGAVRPCAMNAS
jgi:hypothetical protein